MKKSEYLQQLRRLIKKYHPDLCTDERLESAYLEITQKLTALLNSFKNAPPQAAPAAAGIIPGQAAEKSLCLVPVKDGGYAYYKLGVNYYRNIHPNRFYKRSAGSRFVTKTYGEQVAALNTIFVSFNAAEYYFTQVLKGYPASVWAKDAAEKIRLLEKLRKSYETMATRGIEEKVVDSGQFVKEMGLQFERNSRP